MPSHAWSQTVDTEIELAELRVTGDGRGRSLGGALYGPGSVLGRVPGYVAKRSNVGTKTDTPILETAQSISVIGRKQIEDQSPLNINQALRYTPSVTTEQRGGSGSTRLEQFYIRGFTAPIFLDGLVLPGSRDASPNVDPFRLERVDIIKGPASVLYGQSGPGGIVNLVSKVPQFVRHGEIFVQGGGFSEVRGGFDVGGPLGDGTGGTADRFAYRVIGLGWKGDGPVVTTEVERAFINPSVTWRPDADTSLTISGNYQRDPKSGFYEPYLPLVLCLHADSAMVRSGASQSTSTMETVASSDRTEHRPPSGMCSIIASARIYASTLPAATSAQMVITVASTRHPTMVRTPAGH